VKPYLEPDASYLRTSEYRGGRFMTALVGGKTGNIVGYGVVCVGIPIGDPAFVKRFLELKEEEIFDKIDRTVELLGPSQSFTGFQVTRACLNSMTDYLGRGMGATAHTGLPYSCVA
jgi:hypothetical protein